MWEKPNSIIFLSILALVPGRVECLRSNRDPNRPSVTLYWGEPKNCELTGEVTAYEIRFRPSGWWIGDYKTSTVDAPATSILLTGKSGFNSLLPHDFEVRARNAHCEGEWTRLSEYTGTYHNLGVVSHNIYHPSSFRTPDDYWIGQRSSTFQLPLL